jgi:hypothetical protein
MVVLLALLTLRQTTPALQQRGMLPRVTVVQPDLLTQLQTIPTIPAMLLRAMEVMLVVPTQQQTTPTTVK